MIDDIMSELQIRDYKAPKYIRLAEELRQQVRSGELKPGDPIPSFASMKARFGISQTTWEKVHSLLVRDGVIVSEPGRGTFVVEPKRNATTDVLGFPGIAFAQRHRGPHMNHVVAGIQSIADQRGINIMLLNSTSAVGWDKVDGIFVCEPDAEEMLQQAPLFLPSVSLMMPVEGVPSVSANEDQGIRQAVEHLLQLGHRRIACLLTSAHPSCRLRLQSYRAAMNEAGIRIEPGWIQPPDVPYTSTKNRIWGREAMARWIKENWAELGCTALLAQNDEAAIGAIESLQAAGYRVPEHVSVIGFDGTEIGDYFSPRLTTVKVPLFEIGVRGMEVMLEQLEDTTGKPVASSVLPTQLVVGESTAKLL